MCSVLGRLSKGHAAAAAADAEEFDQKEYAHHRRGCSAVCARASAGGAAVQLRLSVLSTTKGRVFEALSLCFGTRMHGQLGTSMWPGVVVVPARG